MKLTHCNTRCWRYAASGTTTEGIAWVQRETGVVHRSGKSMMMTRIRSDKRSGSSCVGRARCVGHGRNWAPDRTSATYRWTRLWGSTGIQRRRNRRWDRHGGQTKSKKDVNQAKRVRFTVGTLVSIWVTKRQFNLFHEPLINELWRLISEKQ